MTRIAAVICGLLLGAGCDSPAEGGPAGSDAGPTSAGCDADFAGCATFEDGGGAEVRIQFGGALGTRFSPKCLRVPVGTRVVWEGAFATHPLRAATCSAQSFASTSSETTHEVVFTAPGNYGYFCSNHGSSTGSGMAGLVQVY